METTALRVAARYQRKQASAFFEPPPAMLKEIGDWMVSVYAGHTLVATESRLRQYTGSRKVADKALKEISDFEAKLPKLADKVRKDGKGSWRFALKTPLEFSIRGVWRGDLWVITVKMSRSPFDRYTESLDLVFKYLDEIKTEVDDIGDKPSHFSKKRDVETYRQEFVEAKLLERKLTSLAGKAKKYKKKAIKKFAIDLSGWKYLTGKELPERWDNITAQLTFGNRSFGGQWRGLDRILEVNVPETIGKTLDAWRLAQADMVETLAHELEHFGQDVLLLLTKSRGGLPSKSLREPGIEPSGFKWGPGPGGSKQKEHALRDIEFYPNLGDSVRIFQRNIKKVSPKDRADAIRIWVGELPVARGRELNKLRQRLPSPLRSVDTMFQTLKKKAPDKWQKAVKEFYKAVAL